MLESLTLQEKLELQALLSERIRRDNQRKWLTYYPDEGPLRRELYPKHMQCFADGAQYQQRLFMAANRVGKTEGVGAYEVALHLTGAEGAVIVYGAIAFVHPLLSVMVRV